MRVVTSFSADGYNLYGKRFVETFLEHTDAALTIYCEDEVPVEENERVRVRDLNAVPGFKEFCAISSFAAARGRPWGEDRYDYAFDANRFGRKVFAQIDAASTTQRGWLYWLDADIEFGGTFTFPKREAFLVYLGRDWPHTCSSFVGFNLDDEMAGEFFRRYWLLYATGTLFALPAWTDCHALDFLREQMPITAISLTAGGPQKGNVFDDVFPMAAHKKGNRKFKPTRFA